MLAAAADVFFFALVVAAVTVAFCHCPRCCRCAGVCVALPSHPFIVPAGCCLLLCPCHWHLPRASVFWLIVVFAAHCHGGAAGDNATYRQSGVAEDDDAYHQSGAAEDAAAYPHGGEAKNDAAYRHGSAANDDAAYRLGGAADNDAR